MKNVKEMTPEELAKHKRMKRNSWIVFGLLVFIRFFFFEHYMVPSSSMTPTLLTGDIIFIKKYEFGWSRLSVPYGGYLPFKNRIELGKPKYGDMAVFVLSRDPSTYYVKRVVALEGDRVQIKNAVLHVNDQPVKFDYVGKFTFRNDAGKMETGFEYRITMPFAKNKTYTVYRNAPIGLGHIDNTPEFKVPKGYVWVQGDFHTGSADSFSPSFFGGPISIDRLVGKPVFVLYGSNARLPQESNLVLWLIQLPWRVLVSLKDTNFKRICRFVE